MSRGSTSTTNHSANIAESQTGEITCHTTGMVYPMHNISCISSNVIYCITCRTCGKQNVGQTLRIKDRIYKHLRDINQANKDKLLGLHCSTTKHEKRDINVHILQFITKAPKSPQAFIIRNRVKTDLYIFSKHLSPMA